jgi:protein-S-isoprenylcysteine O-methyltransferase Ste14
MFGTAIFFGQIRGFIAFCLTFGGWWLKSRSEEQFMVEHFNTPYCRYQEQVKALILTSFEFRGRNRMYTRKLA